RTGSASCLTVWAVRINLESRECILSFIRDVSARRREKRALGQPTECPRASNRQYCEARKPFVVVVDPDPDIRAQMNDRLSGRYEVLVAATESDARKVLAGHAAEGEIILMAMPLNGADGGRRLTKTLRDDGFWTEVPIIAAMARALAEEESKALAAGCNGYLVKPFGPPRIEDLPFRPGPNPSGPWM